MTFLEMVIALALVGTVFALVISVYLTGLKLHSSSDSRSQILQDVQVSNRALRTAVALSSPAGVSVSADAKILSVISPFDTDGASDLSNSGQRRWQAWRLFYHDQERLLMTVVPWTGAGVAAREVPDTVETITGLALPDLAQRGRMVAEHLYSVEFRAAPSQGVVEADWEFRLASKARPEGELLKNRAVYRIRN